MQRWYTLSMQIIADLHLHSRFARAVSKNMTLPEISRFAKIKGIDLVATGDWTHPIWFSEITNELKETNEGIYQLKNSTPTDPKFILSVEISSIYKDKDKTRRIHYLILSPNLKTALMINQALAKRGVNLISDGRPITGLSAHDVAEIALTINEKCLIIPAHIWTPWFSLYGHMSGYDLLTDCYRDLSNQIFAVETGLSSDPAMNWKVDELDNRQILSFSDAHSAVKLGREATVFDLPEVSYPELRNAITSTPGTSSKSRIVHTIEFYPEEGKYHYTGHRNCQITRSPKQTRKQGIICPVCKKELTIGVSSRVETLAKNKIEINSAKDALGLNWISQKGRSSRPPYIMLVPLAEIIAEVMHVGPSTKKVALIYDAMIATFGNEFNVLFKTPISELSKHFEKDLSTAIQKVRSGDISIKPGFDGVFGQVSIYQKPKNPTINQNPLF